MEHVVPGQDPRDRLPEAAASAPPGDRTGTGSAVDLTGGTPSAGSTVDPLLDLTDTDGRKPVVDLTGAGRPVRAEGADGPVAVLHRPDTGWAVPRSLSLSDTDADRDEPSWPRVAGAVLARIFLVLGVGLLLWATAPALLGWSAQVVLTESMTPRINPGDVVLAVDVDPATLHDGQVILFRDPEGPDRSLVHRIAEVRADGSFTTRGDHNQSPDAAPVTPDLVEGMARLRVPFAGLPVLWATQGRWLSLLLLAVAVLALVRIAAADRNRTAADDARGTDPPDTGAGTGPEPGGDTLPADRARDHVAVVVAPPAPPRLRPAVVLVTLGVGVAATGLLLTVAAGGTANAAFRALSPTPTNTWSSAATFVTVDYPAAVVADGPLMFFRLGESGGTVAASSVPGGPAGTYESKWQFGITPQPLPNNAGTGAAPDNPNACLSTPVAMTNPTSYSLEAWFRAAPGATGQLVGFQQNQSGTGGTADRHLYLSPSGAVSFGAGSPTKTVVSTSGGLADNAWHHVVATRSDSAIKLYVDGVQVVSAATNTPWAYTGYWRIGCGDLSGWPGGPSTQANRGVFGGALANVAVYPSVLSAARVAAHYAQR